jgi:hypothetical protein
VECRGCGALVSGGSPRVVAENWNRRDGVIYPEDILIRGDEEDA